SWTFSCRSRTIRTLRVSGETTIDVEKLSEERSDYKMLRKRLRSALPWAGILVSALFAYLAVRHVRFGDVWQGLRTSNYWWLVPSLAMLGVTVFVKSMRWRYLFAPETRPPVGAVVDAVLAGYFFNSVLPARAGEAGKVVALRRRAGTSPAEAAATVLVERV